MVDQSVTTTIDDLVKYLKEHGETESSKLASELKVSEGIIEIWADALEKAGITKISYKVGKMFVAPVTSLAGGIEEVKKTVELKRGIAEAEIEAQVKLVNDVTAKIEEFKRYQSSAEEAYKNRAGEIKTALDSINRLDSQLETAYKRLKGRKDYIDGLITELNKSMSSLDQHAGAAKHKGGDEEAKVLISDMRERTKDADEMISKLDKEFGAAVASSRRSFSELLDGLREENARMKRIVFQRQKDLEELETQSKSYEQGSDAIRRRAHREHEKMLDDITKASSEVDNAYSGATKKITDLRAVLSDLKGHFGGFAQLGDRLNNIRDELGAAEKEKDELTKKLGDLSNQLKAIAALDKFKAEEKAAEMDKVDRKLTETEQGIEHANASLEKIKKDMDEIGK